MRTFTILSLSILLIAVEGLTANAQAPLSDLPVEFFSAQRGRLAVHRNGAYRMRYGRGLTPQGAEVLTTAIGTLGPLLPQIINPVQVPMQAPFDPHAASAYEPPQADCEPLQEDEILDSLVDAAQHSQRIEKLDAMTDKVTGLVKSMGKTPVLPPVRPTGGGGTLSVEGGVVVKPDPAELSAAESPKSNLPGATSGAVATCGSEQAGGDGRTAPAVAPEPLPPQRAAEPSTAETLWQRLRELEAENARLKQRVETLEHEK